MRENVEGALLFSLCIVDILTVSKRFCVKLCGSCAARIASHEHVIFAFIINIIFPFWSYIECTIRLKINGFKASIRALKQILFDCEWIDEFRFVNIEMHILCVRVTWNANSISKSIVIGFIIFLRISSNISYLFPFSLNRYWFLFFFFVSFICVKTQSLLFSYRSQRTHCQLGSHRTNKHATYTYRIFDGATANEWDWR